MSSGTENTAPRRTRAKPIVESVCKSIKTRRKTYYGMPKAKAVIELVKAAWRKRLEDPEFRAKLRGPRMSEKECWLIYEMSKSMLAEDVATMFGIRRETVSKIRKGFESANTSDTHADAGDV